MIASMPRDAIEGRSGDSESAPVARSDTFPLRHAALYWRDSMKSQGYKRPTSTSKEKEKLCLQHMY